MSSIANSQRLYQQALNCIPGGVNSPVRAFKSVGGTPIFIERAKDSYLFSEDKERYIDYVSSWGAIILGHAHPEIIHAMQEQLSKGTSFGTATKLEIELAQLVQKLCPNVELLRLVCSGTEACMSAIRLARGFTQKSKIIKFEGNYHGHADAFLIEAGSGLATFEIDKASGLSPELAQETLVARYNDTNSVEALFHRYKDEIAAVIVEPVAGNMGCVPPREDFLPILRKLCNQNGALLIFDEVMTGFRLALGGAQELFQIEADLVCYGKVLGGGMPLAGFGGRAEIMQHIAPLGKVYQAGTLSGNPVAVSAGLATLQFLEKYPETYASLAWKTNHIAEELRKIFRGANIAVQIAQFGSMMSIFFTDQPVRNFQSARQSDSKLFAKFFHKLLDVGIYIPPSAYESWFLNDALSEEDMQYTLDKIAEIIKTL